MINVNSLFADEELEELKKIDVVFDPVHDYSDDELLDIHEIITENFPYEYDADGNPKRLGRLFENIIDTFYNTFDI